MTAGRANKAKICVVTTTPLIVNFFLRGNLAALASRYDVTLILNLEDSNRPNLKGIDLRVVSVQIERKISLFRDFIALARLVKIFLAHDFRVVHSVAPKAGLLAMIAAWIARVPIRIHTFQGELWATRSGFMRLVLKSADRIMARLATHVLVVSASEQTFLIEQGILPHARSRVLANGSISGVDVTRFRPDVGIRNNVRKDFDLQDTDFLFLFLGRVTRDKGILDLARAFASIAVEFPQARLLIAGPDEDGLEQEIRNLAGDAAAKLRFFGLTDAPERILAAADVVCLPSYREAFGMVILEAAAMGIPSVASRIYGITDAVIEGKTGLLHEPRNVDDLVTQMKHLISDTALRHRLGKAAYTRIHQEFRSELIIEALLGFYDHVDSDELSKSDGT